MPRRNPEDIDHGAIKANPGVPHRAGRAVPQGTSAQAALHNGRECCDGHCLDRTILAALPLVHQHRILKPRTIFRLIGLVLALLFIWFLFSL